MKIKYNWENIQLFYDISTQLLMHGVIPPGNGRLSTAVWAP
jgi:hypothetical protein